MMQEHIEEARLSLRTVQSEKELLEKLIEISVLEFRQVLDPSDFDCLLSMVRTFAERDPVLQNRLNWLGGFIGTGSEEIK